MAKMGWENAKEEMRYVPLAENTATSINTIVKDIEDLTDSLNTSEELHDAWSKITGALGYLSAKDSMFKYKKNKEEKND